MLRELLGGYPARLGAALVCVVGLAVGSASASISNVIFKVRAESSLGSAEIEFLSSELTQGPAGTFNWNLNDSGGWVDLMDGPNVIASLQEASTTIVETPPNASVPYRVRTGFVVVAGSETTTFTITSALLGTPTIDDSVAQVRTFANLTLTDGPGGNGSELVGLAADGSGSYTGNYNGLAPGGVTFASLISGLVISPGGGSASASEAQPNVGFQLTGADVASISNGWKFSVTAGDNVSGNGTMLLLPEPATLALLVLGGFAAVRRR